MSVSPRVTSASLGNRSLGSILVECGRLTEENVAYIERVQGKQGDVRFGEAAKMLGLLSDEDIQFALARQYGYPCLSVGDSDISEELVAAYQPRSPQVEELRALRSHLIHRGLGGMANRSISIVSSERREGRSFLAANLAVVFSQLGQNTLLLDADLRHGRLHQLFGVDNVQGLSSVLSGRVEVAPVVSITQLAALSLLVSGPLPPNPQELIGGAKFGALLEGFSSKFDVIVIDTPAASEYSDAQMIGSQSGGAVMLVRQDSTSVRVATGVCEGLRQFNVSILGTVLSSH